MVNHAKVAVQDKIFSVGGCCTGDDYKLKRSMDVHVLNTSIITSYTSRYRVID